MVNPLTIQTNLKILSSFVQAHIHISRYLFKSYSQVRFECVNYYTGEPTLLRQLLSSKLLQSSSFHQLALFKIK